MAAECRGTLQMTLRTTSLHYKKPRKTDDPGVWHGHCYTKRVHLVPRQSKGDGKAVSGPAAPSLFWFEATSPVQGPLVDPGRGAQAGWPTSCCSSPLSNISIMMSDPPTNSPRTYSCGTVGHSL